MSDISPTTLRRYWKAFPFLFCGSQVAFVAAVATQHWTIAAIVLAVLLDCIGALHRTPRPKDPEDKPSTSLPTGTLTMLPDGSVRFTEGGTPHRWASPSFDQYSTWMAGVHTNPVKAHRELLGALYDGSRYQLDGLLERFPALLMVVINEMLDALQGQVQRAPARAESPLN